MRLVSRLSVLYPRFFPWLFAILIAWSCTACFETKRFFITNTGGPDCGDGIRQGKEACDGSVPRGSDACTLFDRTRFASGTLSCVACALNEAACLPLTSPDLLADVSLDSLPLVDASLSPVAPLVHRMGVVSSDPTAGVGVDTGVAGPALRLTRTDASVGWSAASKVTVLPAADLGSVGFWMKVDQTTADGALIYSDAVRTVRLLKVGPASLYLLAEWKNGDGARTTLANQSFEADEWIFVAMTYATATLEATLTIIKQSGPITTQSVVLDAAPTGPLGSVLLGANPTLLGFVGAVDELKVWKSTHGESALCSEAGGSFLESSRYCVFSSTQSSAR